MLCDDAMADATVIRIGGIYRFNVVVECGMHYACQDTRNELFILCSFCSCKAAPTQGTDKWDAPVCSAFLLFIREHRPQLEITVRRVHAT